MNNPGAAGVVQLQEMFLRVISLAVGLAFITLLVMLVIGGIKFLTSGGEPKAVASAQQTITWAILGVVFLAVAWLILRLIGAFAGLDVTQFCIGFRPYCLI